MNQAKQARSATDIFSVQTVKDSNVTNGVHFRVTDPKDNRIATCYSLGNARRIVSALNALHNLSILDLIDAAIFAGSVIKTHGMYDTSEKIAYLKLEDALALFGEKIDTPGTQQFDTTQKKGKAS